MSKLKPKPTELNLLYFPPKFSQGLNIYSLHFKDTNGNIVSFPTDGELKAKSIDTPSSPAGNFYSSIACFLSHTMMQLKPFVNLVLPPVSKDDHVSESKSH